jgi:sulfatase maturation enzyme AslB (radical SAM superfamily)
MQWLHYAEGSAMLPLLLNLYASRLGDAKALPHAAGKTAQPLLADLIEIAALEQEIELLIEQQWEDIDSGFVAESAEKLRRIARHFRAQLGDAAPAAPTCNAPWVSAVIEADGTVRPCFFHRPIGNIHEKALIEIVNGEPALDFRRQLDIPANPVCQRCVCSLHLSSV